MQVKASIMLAAIFCIAIIGYLFLYRDIPAPPLTPEEKTTMDSLFAKTKSQCIGRYLFDVPEPFYNSLSDSVKINDIRIASERLYQPVFEQRIKLREQRFKSEHTVDPRSQPFLKQIYRLNDNAVIFDRNQNESVPGFSRILEGHLYVDGVAFIVQTEITDYSDERYSKERELFLSDGSSSSTANTKPQKLAEMKDLLSRLSGRKDDEIPTQPGTCIPEGFIRDNGSQNKETILFVYKNEDFTLGVKNNNTLEKDVSLLERGSEIQNAIRSSHSHTMRKGRVSLLGIEAEEWLIRSKQDINDNMVDFFAFTLYGNEKIASYQHPVFSIKLHNRKLVTTHYSDAQLVDIWDRITRTFRVRPGAF
ncbi:T6SS immunity protein Tli4 family protein [Serratia aquatilis]|uniref:T6SS immunity protein Tli4 family protein n=1 Tax=Serratia aquatilis TaxID=1737515 RepID=A0ABV6EIK7_9GAMM